jgi:hypothetical protein
MKQTKNGQKSEQAPPPPPPQPEDALPNWGEETVTGMENVNQQDLGIPFLVIVHANGPEVNKAHKNYESKKIEGCGAGDVVNTLSRKIIHKEGGDPMQFIPCSYIKLWQEWKPREAGGGFIQSHKSAVILSECTRNEKKKDVLPNGNIIITTAYFYGFYWDEESQEWKQAIIAMTSTQLKKAKAWLNMATSIRIRGQMPPLYSHVYKLYTTIETNAEGSWYGWVVNCHRALITDDAHIIGEARNVAKQNTDLKMLNAPAPADDPGEDVPYEKPAGQHF